MVKSAPKFSKFIIFSMFAILSIPLLAKELLMLTDDGPPHMIAATKSGIDIDITREILFDMGHQVKLGFAPLKRTMHQVANKEADLFLPTFFQQDTTKLFISAPIINYQPIAFALKKNRYQFKEISDLAVVRLVTFQGASGYFGNEFVKLSKHNGYAELHDMSKLPEMLIKNRCDVVVLDYYIFYYYLQKYLNQNSVDYFAIEEIERFTLFPEVKAHVGFHDKQLRDKFNRQLRLYKNLGKDKIVINKYIGAKQAHL